MEQIKVSTSIYIVISFVALMLKRKREIEKGN